MPPSPHGTKIHIVPLRCGQAFPEQLEVLHPRLVVLELSEDYETKPHVLVAKMLLRTPGTMVAIHGLASMVQEAQDQIKKDMGNQAVEVRELLTFTPGYGDTELYCQEVLRVMTRARITAKV